MIRAVIFDMDGVIVNSEPLWEKSNVEQLRRHGIVIKNKEAYKRFLNSYVRGRNQRQGLTATKKKFGFSGSLRELQEEKISILFRIFDRELKKIPGTIPFIKKLHKNGFRLALASSSPYPVIRHIINRYKLRPYFHHIVSGDDFIHGKPNPEVFLHCAKLLGSKPTETLVIEDTRSGVLAAHRAKMKCIALKQPYTPYKYLKTVDLVVNNLNDIKISTLGKL